MTSALPVYITSGSGRGVVSTT